MNIVLYNNASPTNKAVKDLTQVATLDGYLREGTSIVNPHIMVEQTDLPVFNYVSIESFNRSYFVETIANINVNLWEIVLHCDVLSTYWNSIKEAPCIVSRSETNRIDNLIDNEIWTTVDSLYETITFESEPFKPNENQGDIERYVLIVAGAGTAERSDTISVTYTLTDPSYIVADISQNGVSYDRQNSAFWIPATPTFTSFTFTIRNTSAVFVPVVYNVTATLNGGTWTFTTT